MTALRPCPFCGSRRWSAWHLGYLPPETPWVVECGGCFAQGPRAATEEEALTKWGKEAKE